jgi:hypothetical protein
VSTSSTERELSPDRPLVGLLVKEVMKHLDNNEEAAYRIWLLLSTKFGAGQKLWH